MNDMLIVPDVAKLLNTTEDMIYHLVRQGQIDFDRLGKKQLVFKRKAVKKYLSEKSDKLQKELSEVTKLLQGV